MTVITAASDPYGLTTQRALPDVVILTQDCLIILDTVIAPLSTQRNAEYPKVEVTLEDIDIKYKPLS